MRTPLEQIAQQIKAGTLQVQIGKVFHLDEIVQAHQLMDANKAGGKIIVLTRFLIKPILSGKEGTPWMQRSKQRRLRLTALEAEKRSS